METIPLRELRNSVSAVLRRAEAGERFAITVNGRPVAELGPLDRPRPYAPASRLARVLADSPVDRGWPDELRRQREEDHASARDGWAH